MRLTTEKIDNSAAALAAAIALAEPNPKVVVEACYGWYWAADVHAGTPGARPASVPSVRRAAVAQETGAAFG